MEKSHIKNIYQYNAYAAILLFAVVSFVWLLVCNRYHIIAYHEEEQLFRTDYLYFSTYMSAPGGITEYLASFLTQWYYYPWLGAFIITCSIVLVYTLLLMICRAANSANTDRFFIIPFLIPILLLISCSDTNFRLSNILGLCIALSSFWIYLLIEGRMRYAGGVLLYTLVYFVAGGNALIFASILIIQELFDKNRSFVYVLFIIVLSTAIPYISYLWIYTIPLKTAYLLSTPFDLISTVKTYNAAWFGIPAVFLILSYLARKNWLEKVQAGKILIPYYILIALSLFLTIRKTTNPDMDTIARMGYEVQHGNWEEVLKIRSGYETSSNNILATYYTNIALSELGVLSSKMFHYPQTGTAGLLINWAPTFFTPWYNGELYYRLGIIPEAEHCAYESMVNNRKEYGSKTIRRLVYTTMLRKDNTGFEKYIKLFENSPVYSKWADQQREHYTKALIDTAYRIPDAPMPARCNDMLMNYSTPEYNFIMLLQADSSNKKAFEYLIGSLLLQKDLKTMLSAFDSYYGSLSYDKMPRHYEEALLISRVIFDDAKDVLEKYPVSQETLNEFKEYADMSKLANHQQAVDNLKKRYGHTYWYYYQHAKPILLEQAKAAQRY